MRCGGLGVNASARVLSPRRLPADSIAAAGGWGGEAGYEISGHKCQEGGRKQPRSARWMETIQPALPGYIIKIKGKKKKGGGGKKGGERKKNLLFPLPPFSSPPRGIAEIFLNYRLFQ